MKPAAISFSVVMLMICNLELSNVVYEVFERFEVKLDRFEVIFSEVTVKLK